MITNQELKNFKYQEQMLKFKELEIERLRTLAEKTTGSLSTANKGSADITSRQERFVEQAEELIKQLEEDRLALNESEIKIRRFINNIDDELTKAVFTYRSLYGFTWSQVASALKNNNSPDNLMKIYFRYLNSHCNDEL